jgi:phosphoribosylglycinamide formyltransferase 1
MADAPLRRAPLRIGWFATGQGTGSRALLTAAQAAIARGELRAAIPFLFCNREPGEHENSDLLLALAAEYGIPGVTLSDRRYRRQHGGEVARAGEPLPAWRSAYDRAVLELIEPYGMDLGMLAGYMLIFGPEACARHDFLNLHPAAPDGPIGTWQRVIWQLIDGRAAESGVLINRAIPAVDEGPVVAYCRYPLRGPAFDPLWRAIGDRTAADLREREGEDLPLFRAIRAAGVAREVPLMVQTLVALANGRVWLSNGSPHTADGPLSGGLDLTPEVERAVAIA